MPKIFVKNPGQFPAREMLPGVGTYEIGPGESIEIKDVKTVAKNGTEQFYGASAIADSLVADSGRKLIKEIK